MSWVFLHLQFSYHFTCALLKYNGLTIMESIQVVLAFKIILYLF